MPHQNEYAIVVRCKTKEERDYIKRAAMLAGLSLQQFTHDAVMRAARTEIMETLHAPGTTKADNQAGPTAQSEEVG